MTQGLILAFQSLGVALRGGNGKEVARWADLSISLLNASAGAFILTGDFPPEEYENNSTEHDAAISALLFERPDVGRPPLYGADHARYAARIEILGRTRT